MPSGKKKNNSVFATNVKALIKKGDLTQEQMAEKAKVSQQTIAKWASGTVPNGVNFSNFAEANGVSTQWLLEVHPEEEAVDNITPKSKLKGEVKSELDKLMDRVKQKAESTRGAKADLARMLDVDPARISEWLSGKKEPGGEYALRLLKWVEGRS